MPELRKHGQRRLVRKGHLLDASVLRVLRARPEAITYIPGTKLEEAGSSPLLRKRLIFTVTVAVFGLVACSQLSLLPFDIDGVTQEQGLVPFPATVRRRLRRQFVELEAVVPRHGLCIFKGEMMGITHDR